MKAKAGDVFTIYNHYLNRYTACQITKVEPNGSAVCLPLDWSGPEPLGAHQLGGLKPLYKDFMYWPRCLRLCNVAAEVPSHYIYVGNRPSFCQESSDVYGPWDDGYEVYRQLQWQEIPEGQRRVFKSAIDSTETVQLAGTEVRVNTRRLHDKYVPFGHAEDLRSLPCLSALNLECWHPGLLEYLRTNPFLTELSFAVPGCQQLDLRGSHLSKLLIDLTDVEELWLNEEMEQLCFLNTEPERCRIHAKEEGARLMLQFRRSVRAHPELTGLHSLHGIEINEIDLQELSSDYPHLRELRLWGKPGNIRNFAAVEQFRELEEFSTYDLFGFTAQEIPGPERMPHLRWFWMTSLPEDAAKEAKKLYQKKRAEGFDLWITKPRKAEWLAQNLDNPFRGWDGAEHIPAAAARKAANQYRKTRSELLKLSQEPGQDVQEYALAAVAAYTQTFNKMRFIETEERDEISTALWGILDALPEGVFQKNALLEEFERLRNF